MKTEWQVVVGNIGTVYTGNNRKEAVADFVAYAALSRRGIGRAGNESVALLKNGDLVRERRPANEQH